VSRRSEDVVQMEYARQATRRPSAVADEFGGR
jgi:hypothetical protein